MRLNRTTARRGCHFLLAAMLSFLGLVGCGGSTTPTPPKPAVTTKQSVPYIELVFPYGSEKKNWLEAVTTEFNRAARQTASGKQIKVSAIPMGSGELTTEILEGRVKAHLASPASGVFIELGNSYSQAAAGKPLVGKTTDLVMSPVVIAMWKPMAETLGWPDKQLGWADILEMAGEKEGWSKHGYPQWGQFKFGHTHPEYSNSGIISLFAEVYAGAGKVNNLTLDDLHDPRVAQFLGDIETAVVHYGSSTGFFGRKMFAGGPRYLSAAVLYENMVIESYAETGLEFPVVAIYPKEGSFWSDHPVGIIDREWVTEEHREAAERYIEFLTAQPQQKRAMEFGFRPAEVSIALGAPIDEAHGVNPQEPQTTLEVPSAQVARAVIDLWKKHKKHSNIILVLDTSGSMKGEKIANAKEGGDQFIAMLGDEDVISLLPFNNQVRFAGERLKLRSDRAQAKNLIDSYFADGGTSLYDAISMAYRQLMDNPAPGMISAIVVLSDGKDTDSSMKIDELLELIDGDDEQSSAIRIFTIAYGNEANTGVLEQISNATNAKSFEGHPDNIREVFKEISTFF